MPMFPGMAVRHRSPFLRIRHTLKLGDVSVFTKINKKPHNGNIPSCGFGFLYSAPKGPAFPAGRQGGVPEKQLQIAFRRKSGQHN